MFLDGAVAGVVPAGTTLPGGGSGAGGQGQVQGQRAPPDKAGSMVQ